jgi:hypothetical protein
VVLLRAAVHPCRPLLVLLHLELGLTSGSSDRQAELWGRGDKCRQAEALSPVQGGSCPHPLAEQLADMGGAATIRTMIAQEEIRPTGAPVVTTAEDTCQ